MPAGFPGYSANALNTPTPGTGEGSTRRAAAAALPPQLPAFAPPSTPGRAQSSRQQQQFQTPQAQSQAQAQAQGVPVGRTTSVAGVTSHTGSAYGDNQSQFRFRGAFASQPPTPGMSMGMNGADGQNRRLGALNSRA